PRIGCVKELLSGGQLSYVLGEQVLRKGFAIGFGNLRVTLPGGVEFLQIDRLAGSHTELVDEVVKLWHDPSSRIAFGRFYVFRKAAKNEAAPGRPGSPRHRLNQCNNSDSGEQFFKPCFQFRSHSMPPLIEYEQSTGVVREVFDDIRATRKTDEIN